MVSQEYPDLPPCLILIDKEGRMFHQGAEMINQGINGFLLSKLRLDDQGRYIIELKEQRCWVEVEDTPLVVQRVSGELPGNPTLSLSDGSREPLDPALVWSGPDNVLYTKVRQGSIPARFNRPAYYQVAEWVQETDQGFALAVQGRLYPIREGHPDQARSD